jgi:predicted RNA-binding protein associated with RNAse of E/G family
VFDARHTQTTGLRHYAFPDRWFTANVTIDLDGSPVEAPGDEFAYNCDVSTPLWHKGARAYEVDLELDVLVRADGRTYEVTDREDFEHACEAGWITWAERDGALRGRQEVTDLVESGELRAFLERVCPFGSIREAPFAEPYEVLPAELYPQLRPASRSRAHSE